MKSPACRRISIRVHPADGVKVVIPGSLSYDEGLRFFLLKRDWVVSTIARQRERAEKARRDGKTLPLLCNGTADSMLKVFEEYGPPALGDWFMGATFIFASIACLIIMSAGKGRIGRKELAAGLALGIPNYMSSLLLLKSLPSVSAYIAYPTYSVGAILIVMAASAIIFRERLSRQSYLGIAMIVPAILLLNI